jgi:predicted transcriptional regulator
MQAVSYTLRINADLKGKLDAQAALEKRSTAFILQQAAMEYLDKKEAFQNYVTRLETEADKGDFISEEAMSEWVNSWGRANELSMPKA